MQPSDISAGDYITWDPDSVSAVRRVTSVSEFRIAYTSVDGVTGAVEATLFRSLADGIADWQPASRAQADFFKKHRRQAPANYLD